MKPILSLIVILSLLVVSIPASAITVSAAVSQVLAAVINEKDAKKNFKKYLCRKGDAAVASKFGSLFGKKTESKTVISARSFNGIACSNETMAAATLAICKGANPGQDPKGSEFKTSQCFTKAKAKLKIKSDAKIAETAKKVLKDRAEKHDAILKQLCPYLPDDVAKYACEDEDEHATDDEQEREEPEEE